LHPTDVYVALQCLEFSAHPGQYSDVVLPLRNAGAIVLDISLESQEYAELFTITPERCQIEPGGSANVLVRFHAPASPATTVYERSADVYYFNCSYHELSRHSDR